MQRKEGKNAMLGVEDKGECQCPCGQETWGLKERNANHGPGSLVKL